MGRRVALRGVSGAYRHPLRRCRYCASTVDRGSGSPAHRAGTDPPPPLPQLNRGRRWSPLLASLGSDDGSRSRVGYMGPKGLGVSTR